MNLRHKFFLDHVEALQKFFEEDLGLIVKIGGEIEFYLRSESEVTIKEIISQLELKCLRVEREKGWQQYECVFNHNQKPIQIAKSMYELKNLAKFLARQNSCQASFDAKPYPDDYGSALHLHVSIHNKKDKNLFVTTQIDENAFIGKAIAGILEISEESVYLLCQNANDYKRFISKFLAPTHISWGGNNRTTILRIPDSKPEFKRIEFRLPPSSADPAVAIMVMMIGLIHGLSTKLPLPERTFGNAFDNQYNLIPIPQTIEDAKIAFVEGGKILYYMNKISPNLVPDFKL